MILDLCALDELTDLLYVRQQFSWNHAMHAEIAFVVYTYFVSDPLEAKEKSEKKEEKKKRLRYMALKLRCIYFY